MTETYLTVIITIINIVVLIIYLKKFKGPDDRHSRDRYEQTRQLTRQMQEQLKKK